MNAVARASSNHPGRVRRVPYDLAERLVGTRVLTHARKDRTLFDWRSRGVPPEWLCWRLIEAAEAEQLGLSHQLPDAETVRKVRTIAERTGERGHEWEHLVQLVEMVYRNVRRAP